MRAARAAAAAAAAGWLLASACGSMSGRPRRPPPPDPDLRIWAPQVIHWSPGADRSMRFAIENATQRTLEVREPDARGARVAIFVDSGEAQACGVEGEDPPAAEPVKLAPGDQVAVRVDLGEACRNLAPGEYRYELSYRMPRGGSTAIPTSYGTLVVEGPSRAVGRRGPEVGRPASPRGP
jgi:hypothetical protein